MLMLIGGIGLAISFAMIKYKMIIDFADACVEFGRTADK